MKTTTQFIRLAWVFGLLSLSFTFSLKGSEPNARVTAIRAPGAAKVFKALTDRDGAIHLVCDSESGPSYLKSIDSGVTFSEPIPLVDSAAQKPGLKFSLWDMALGKDGSVHVAMGNNGWQLKLPQEEWSLHYATLAPGAKAFSPVRNLNRKPSEGFSLAANERGGVTACFLSGKLFAMASRDDGKTFTPFTELNPAWNPCDCCTTSATYGSDGRLALLYREETNNQRDMYVVLWDQRGKSKPTRTRVSSTSWAVNTCPMTYFTIQPAKTGYVAAWPTQGRIYFARLDKNGAVRPPGEIKTPGANGMRTGVLALSAADGATLIAWKNKELLGWQLYDAKGEPQGNAGSEPSAGNGAAGVLLKDGRFLLLL